MLGLHQLPLLPRRLEARQARLDAALPAGWQAAASQIAERLEVLHVKRRALQATQQQTQVRVCSGTEPHARLGVGCA